MKTIDSLVLGPRIQNKLSFLSNGFCNVNIPKMDIVESTTGQQNYYFEKIEWTVRISWRQITN